MQAKDRARELVDKVKELPKNMPQNLMGEMGKGELFLLNYIHSRGGVAGSGEMSEALGTSTARIAAAINNMERKGWVRRETDPNDRRRTLVHMRESGTEALASYQEHIIDRLAAIFAELGEEDTDEWIRITMRIAEVTARLQEEDKCFWNAPIINGV